MTTAGMTDTAGYAMLTFEPTWEWLDTPPDIRAGDIVRVTLISRATAEAPGAHDHRQEREEAGR